MTEDERQEIALWRLGVLGPLVSARLEHGDRRAHFEAAAARVHQRPDGRSVRLSPRTIEAWHHAYARGGFAALFPEVRSDRGHSRAIAADVSDLVVRAKREKRRRSVRRIIGMLERAGVVRRGELKRSTVHRLLQAQGISSRPRRGSSVERRSFLLEHGGDLWLGDALHARNPVIAPDGKPRKAYMLSQIDVATRFVPHSFFAVGEGAIEHEHGFKEALLKHGRPRGYYVDGGAAYKSKSLRLICAELGIRLLHTPPGEGEAKGAIEKWHRTWREEVEDELPDEPVPLAELNAIHWAWLAVEYHARKHDTTGRAPLEHWLAEAEHLRPLPRHHRVDEVFLHREHRTVRRDGTVRLHGGFYEVRAEIPPGSRVELRFDPSQPEVAPRVFEDGRFVCDTVPLDRLRNASRRRRRDLDPGDVPPDPTGLDPLGLIQDEYYRRTRTPRSGKTHQED